MDIKELIILSIEALKSNLVRTGLTMLGIIIGIASVIIIMSLGQGATASIVEEISSFGANLLTVQAGSFRRGPGGGGSTSETLVEKDAEAIKALSNISEVSGVISTSKQITYQNQSTNSSIKGVEENYNTIHSLELSQGDFFDSSSVRTQSKVMVIGDEVVTTLFGEDAQVTGQTVRVDGKTFKIIGVIPDSSEVLIPITAAQSILTSQQYYNQIDVSVSDSDLVDQASSEIEDLLLIRHDILNADNADFSIRSSQEMIDSISSVTGTMTAMLSGIAAISLVVGGIGIMNIMLVTVTERTKEIGLLKAIGAKRADILTQFLIEAIVVTVIGGIVGIILGLGITYMITLVLSIPFIVSPQSIILAMSVSAGVGILFGWYPAQSAAKLQPIDALRHE